MKRNFGKIIGAGLVVLGFAGVLLYQNFDQIPNIACSTPGRLTYTDSSVQFCDGSKLISMKNQATGACSKPGMIFLNGADVNFCDGGTSWSIRGAPMGSCSVNGSIGWNGSVPTLCLSGTLYSASTPSYVISEVFQQVFGRSPTGNELNSLLASLPLSTLGFADLLSAMQAAVQQNKTLTHATDSIWTLSSGGQLHAQILSCQSGDTLIGGDLCLFVNVASGDILVANASGYATSPGGVAYAYAPTIIYTQGVYHAYYCSTGVGGRSWDYIRHETSPDLVGWSGADVMLTATAVERSTCDPSVVRFDAGDGLYYYMVYSGNAVNVQTLNFIARSPSPYGPFLKYTDRGTWEQNPPDAHAIVWPAQSAPDVGQDDSGQNVYGAGQPSLVVHNGIVYQWYTDTTRAPGGIFLITSNDMIHWSDPQLAYPGLASIDVKYDQAVGRFMMFEITDGDSDQAQVTIQASTDGLNWTNPTVICDTNCLPHGTNNIGVSGDDQGNLMQNQFTLIAYGAPPSLNAAPERWAYWNLWGRLFTISP